MTVAVGMISPRRWLGVINKLVGPFSKRFECLKHWVKHAHQAWVNFLAKDQLGGDHGVMDGPLRL